MFLGIAFQSCKKEMSTEDAKAKLAEADQELTTLVTSVRDGDGVALIKNFGGFAKKRLAHSGSSREWLDEMFDALDQVIDIDQLDTELNDEGRFYFSHYLGAYTWHQDTQTWTKESSDHISFSFPSEENATENDVLFSIDSYVDAQATGPEGETMWVPTVLHTQVKQNDVKVLGFDINNISFDENLFYFYTKIDASLFVSPVTADYYYENVSPTNFTTSYDVSNGTESFGVSASLNTLHELDEDFTEQDLKDISGDIKINTLDFRYAANLEHIADYNEDPTDAQINADINVDVYVEDEKIGILLVDNEVVYIEYNDGTREKFEDAFSGLIDGLNGLSSDFEAKYHKSMRKNKVKFLKFMLTKSHRFSNIKHFVKTEYKTLKK